MDLILVHGMGRTPLSMLHLRNRLRKQGFNAYLFGYSPTFETLAQASNRLEQAIRQKIKSDNYALIGHSLGTVIIRQTLTRLGDRQPVACFFLAPPMVACKAAKFFSHFWLFRLLTGEMGQLLAQDSFMSQLTMPAVAKIYAGTAGPRAAWLPFGMALNDGILSVEEASGSDNSPLVLVSASHTFIMNSKVVSDDICKSLRST